MEKQANIFYRPYTCEPAGVPMEDNRIRKHPVLEFERGEEIYFEFEGERVKAYPGETIAAALYANGLVKFTESKRHHRPRGFFCAIGKCSSCIMKVDGIPHVRTCTTPAEDGMKVERHGALPEFPTDVPLKAPRPLELDIDVAIVGAGPAGLSAAIVAARYGLDVHVFDEGNHQGGQLVKQTHQFFGSHREEAGTRGIDLAVELKEEAHKAGVHIHGGSTVLGYYPEMTLTVEHENKLEIYRAKAMAYCTGAVENYLAFENNDLPGIYGAGGVQTLMNEYGIIPGKRVLMIGSGNVGLIVSYQLLQAGVDVVEVIEAMPYFGGYQVHASKLRRAGVPIRTRHTIKRALGTEMVTGAVVHELDEYWQPIPGTERELECDVICIAVGLHPDNQFLRQAGAEMKYVRELGGYVPVRTPDMETTVEGIYVAGDAAGIEEATVAALEGKLVGYAVAERLMGGSEEITGKKEEVKKSIEGMRKGPYGEYPRRGVKMCTLEEEVC